MSFETTRLGGVVSTVGYWFFFRSFLCSCKNYCYSKCSQVPTFPAASDAVQVTVVAPIGKLEPVGGVSKLADLK